MPSYEFKIVRDPTGETCLECPVTGEDLTTTAIFNKGTAFTERERDELGLRGLLPPRVSTMEQQVERVMENYRRKESDLERYIHLISLMDRNETLFYRIILDHLEEMLPIVYTPTVGQACIRFGHIFRRNRGLYLTIEDRGRVGSILANWPFRDVRVIVVTDGERILGLGDLGANGMGIPIGKLSLYVAAGGVHPAHTLPVCLDAGTNREELLGDPLYLGLAHRRIRGEPYDDLIEEFFREAQKRFPNALIQFEDFAERNSFRLLDAHRERACTFNDDIQGTAAVALAAILASERSTGRRLADERLVIAGAGSAGVGIARQVAAAMVDAGLSESEAHQRLWLLDSKGLLAGSRDTLMMHKRDFVRDGASMPLDETVRRVKPTVLIGATGRPGLFSGPLLGQLAERPLVLPLSNPTDNVECTPEQVRAATKGGLVATGSPFAGVSQCNNVYIFPGMGLGVLSSRAPRVTDRMFLAAARTLASMAPGEGGFLFPPLHEIRTVSREIARAVAGPGAVIEQWEPVYLPYRRPR